MRILCVSIVDAIAFFSLVAISRRLTTSVWKIAALLATDGEHAGRAAGGDVDAGMGDRADAVDDRVARASSGGGVKLNLLRAEAVVDRVAGGGEETPAGATNAIINGGTGNAAPCGGATDTAGGGVTAAAAACSGVTPAGCNGVTAATGCPNLAGCGAPPP